jgi:N-acetylglucosamine-6-phosphate deacetylase
MATLTPARIAGVEQELGSIAAGKRADLLVLSRELEVRDVYRGDLVTQPQAAVGA